MILCFGFKSLKIRENIIPMNKKLPKCLGSIEVRETPIMNIIKINEQK